MKLGLTGNLSLSEIAQRLGRSRATIQTWFNNYREGGIEGLLPSKALHDEAKKQLLKKSILKKAFIMLERRSIEA